MWEDDDDLEEMLILAGLSESSEVWQDFTLQKGSTVLGMCSCCTKSLTRRERLYRMKYCDFEYLVYLLDPYLHVNNSNLPAPPMSTELVLHCVLRRLAGGSYLDIRLVGRISVPGFYIAIHRGMDAIMAYDELAYSFPQGDGELNLASSSFISDSSPSIVKGCVACIDGWLCQIQTPRARQEMCIHIFQDTIMIMVRMFKLLVMSIVDLSKCVLLHLEEQMILLHFGVHG